MATPDLPAEAVEAAHYHPCSGVFCAPGGVLVGWSAEPPVLVADIRAQVLAEVDAALRELNLNDLEMRFIHERLGK